MRDLLLVILVCSVLTAAGASAKTWHILPDGTGDAPTIKAGINSAAAGDTVLVACGTYYEYNIGLKSKVYLTSETGLADCVTINAQDNGRVFYANRDTSASLVGFTVLAGVEGEASGAGIYETQSMLEVANCVFSYNVAYHAGGGAYLSHSASVYTNCVFSDNYCLGWHYCQTEGGGVCIAGPGSPSFVNCAFMRNITDYGNGGGAAVWWFANATFEGCVFVQNEAAWGFGGGGLEVVDHSHAELVNCTFHRNYSPVPYLGGGVMCRDTSSVTLKNTIIASSRSGSALYWDGTGTKPVITCCDFYGNPDGDWVGPIADQYGINGNICKDPLFCDPADYDFSLCSTSPCLDTEQCGVIGACGLGCMDDGTAVAWTDVTTAILGHRGPGSGLAWVDYDNDGDLDIYFTNRYTYMSPIRKANVLLRNDSLTAGGFVDSTPSILADPANSRGCPWGDYDGDGDPDLYVSIKGANKLIRNDGNGNFVDVTAPPLDDAGTGQAAAWFDCDNDGDLDLYLVNNGDNKLFRNDGAGSFSDATVGPLGDDSWGIGLGLADYDDDGDMDIYVANYDNTANVLMRNDGGGVFTDVTTPVLACPLSSYGAAWGDYDNDGDLDIYVTSEGANSLLRNDGGTFTDVTAWGLDDDGYGRSAAWGDHDNDGDLDLYVVNWDGSNRIFRNEGGGVFTESPGCGSSAVSNVEAGFSTAWADYDKDGDLDLYVVNDDSDYNRLIRNELAPGRHWLEVDPVGVVSNTDGVGVRVRIVAGGVSQMREITGASGFASQGPLTAWFGLGTEALVDTVEVTWPASGIVQRLTAVSCDQTLEVVEDDMSGLVDTKPVPAVFRLHPVRPNPFSAETAIRYDLPRGAHVDLAVYDVSGRLVRRVLENRLNEPGYHTAYWNGRNAKGERVAPGVYFCRLSAGTYTGIERMLLLR